VPATAIRPARFEDLDALLEMIAALGAHHGDASHASKAQLAGDLFTAIPWVFALIADGPEGVVGYALLGRLYRPQGGQRGMEMHNLFVVPQSRSQGIGRHLVAASVDHARNLGCQYLGVGTHPDNAGAQAFYAALGFGSAAPPGSRYRLALD
jgi:ribosomal protein S18 acetylase RimI-like enzyme